LHSSGTLRATVARAELSLGGACCPVVPRALWKATLRLQLVTVPVKLYPALASAKDKITFHMLNPRTHNRIKLVPHDPETGEPVDKADLVKGYEFEKGRFVVLEGEEMEALKHISDRIIELERFVDGDEVDPVYLDHPYLLGPDGDEAAERYAVVRDAMKRTEKVGIGRMVFHGRERVILVEPMQEGIALTTLHSPDEVRSDAKYFDEIGEGKLDEEMIDLAAHIIRKKSGSFDPAKIVDKRQARLHELIDAKLKGKTFTFRKPKEPAKIIDLKEVLRRAAEAEGAAPAKAAAGDKPKRAAKKKTATRTRTKATRRKRA
jgi:DNA end-binding protein Ku